MPQLQWQIQPTHSIPADFLEMVSRYTGGIPGHYVAQLLWQRGLCTVDRLPGFLNPELYQPTSPFEFGAEMHQAIDRLQQARNQSEKVAIWGDFDADGITATAVLWEGLGQFFAADQLTYTIPNRLIESHGLSCSGITALAEQGYSLIVTCDNGSTNLAEIEYAQSLGIDVIITDHHTLPPTRPPVVAILNPRALPSTHPLAHLSGVAVAYKLVEALYTTLPDVPQRPLEDLLDLVAIGLIADLVQLTGDCRYLAQRGIEKLQQNQTAASRPGITRLLELCKRNGDRPTDISFGIGPRINAISRIHGDARFCVELLTSKDVDRCRKLAEETELANTRRKSLQREVAYQVKTQLAQLDLSTTSIIVLADPQWSVGILGLVAGQIAQEYGRPTILLSLEEVWEEQEKEEGEQLKTQTLKPKTQSLARGSARSVNQIDLYQLVQAQAHLLTSFGGHPLAMGLSLPVENLALFTEAINRCLREQLDEASLQTGTIVRADLTVTVAELNKELFRELKLVEPCGMGNPVPKLLIRNCWFSRGWNANIQDWRGRKVRYIKTEFEIYDDSTQIGFPGVWWDHYKDELPAERCDAIVELDFNTYKKRYEVRLIAVRLNEQQEPILLTAPVDWVLDYRRKQHTSHPNLDEELNVTPLDATALQDALQVICCPSSWDELYAWFRRAFSSGKPLALTYPEPVAEPPIEVWQRLIGIAKFLSRTGQTATRQQFLEKLGVGDRSLQIGFKALKTLGFHMTASESGFYCKWQAPSQSITEETTRAATTQFLTVVQEEQFRRRYFYEVPLSTIQAVANQSLIKLK